jgi:hypothetical protein
MNAEDVRRTLSGYAPQHDVARAITALLNGMLVADMEMVCAPADGVSDAELRQLSGRVGAIQDLKRQLAGLWARTAEPQPYSGSIL